MTKISYMCPECLSTSSFEVEANCPVMLTVDGEGDVIDEQICASEQDFFDTDDMTCNSCGHSGKARKFRVETVIISGLPMIIEKETQKNGM